MQPRAEIFAGVCQVAEKQLEVSICRETDLLRDFALDSIKQMAFIIALENHFRICFEPGDEQEILSVGNVVDVIGKRLECREPYG